MINDNGKPRLSAREKQLIGLATEGFTDTAIAHKLGISEATVGTYWGRIRTKLGPHSRTELVAKVLREENKQIIVELMNANKRLVKQVADSLHAESLLDGLCPLLLENAPDAIVVINQNGQIKFANLKTLHEFGYSTDELLDKGVEILVPERLRNKLREHFNQFLTAPSSHSTDQHVAFMAIRKDGTELLLSGALSVVESKEGYFIICIMRELEHDIKYATDLFDISEEPRAYIEQAL